jgi:hypothetical protein
LPTPFDPISAEIQTANQQPFLMSSILQELEQQIAGITSSVEKSNVG